MPIADPNPYSAPATPIVAAAGARGRIRMEGDQLAIPIGASLPPVCLITGKSSSGKSFERELVWATPWVYAFLLLGVWVVLIAYLIVRKKGRLRYHFDGEVVARMGRIRKVGLLTAGGLLLPLIAGIVLGSGPLIALPAVAMLIVLIVCLVRMPRIHVAKIDKQYIYLKKVHADAVAVLLAEGEAA